MSAQEALDLEDLTPKQLRKMIGRIMRSRLPNHKKTDEEKAESADKEAKDKDDLAELMAEGKNTNTPKVSKDDLPKSGKDDDEDDDDDKEEEDD